MKKKIIKIISIVMALAIVVAVAPRFSIPASATSKGSASCSTSAQDNAAKIGMSLYGASYTSGNTATYIVDRCYYKTMSDFGNIYSTTFEGIGMYYSTNITASGAFSISNTATANDVLINAGGNTPGSTSAGGTLVGNVPEPGQSASVTITSYLTVRWRIDGQMYNLPVFSNSTSVSLTAVVIGVDSTELQELVLKYSDYKASCWTAESWATFSTAYSTAKSVATSTTALQDEIDSALSALKTAIAGLEHSGDRTECAYCTGGSTGNTDKSIESFYDLSYGNSNMDLFMPANANGDVALVLFIHGGAWIGGDKSEFTSWAYNACSKYGIIAATVNYRFADCFNVTGWGILDDIQSAVTKIKSMAADRGMNVTKMMTAGHSAGGHLSLMYAYARQDSSPVRPVCVWDMAGPTTLYNQEYLKQDGLVLALSAVCGQYFTADQAIYAFIALENMSPVKYAGSAVPTLICHGMQDSVVPYSDGAALNVVLNDVGVEHTFITFPLSNHGLESDPDCYNQMMSEYDRYVRTYLLPGGVPTVVHHYDSEVVPAVTCAQKGYTLYTCKDCGKYYVDDVTEIAHTPGEWTVVTPATDDTDGLEAVSCTVCGNVIEERVIPKLNPTDESGIVIAPESGIILEESSSILYGFGADIDLESISDYVSAADQNARIEVVPTENGYGTGTLVNVVKNGETLESYTVLISGDATGDAVIDESDFVMIDLYNAMLIMPEEDDPTFKGMDCNKDGVVDESDMVLVDLVNAFMGEIDQVNGGIVLF
ncbi:MAG: alpha/beta hydrolase fold domain-containing protein [Clostridia bacterium]|nr:alpha/beta hydrolase fold domain-containing protein [Clostridia bacterium]